MGTVEVLSVLAGHLSLRVGSTELELAEGDTVMFEAHAPHRYGCVGTGPVRFTMVVLQPGDAGLVPPTSIAPRPRSDARTSSDDRSSPRSAPPDPLSGSGSTARRADLPPRRNAGNPAVNLPLDSFSKPEGPVAEPDSGTPHPPGEPRRRTSNRPVASEGRVRGSAFAPSRPSRALHPPAAGHPARAVGTRAAHTCWPAPPRCAGASRSPPSSAVRCPLPVPPSRSTGSRSSATTRTTTSRRSVSPPTAGRTPAADDTDGHPTTPPPSPRSRRVAGARHQRAGRHRPQANEEGQRLAEKQESDDDSRRLRRLAAAPRPRRPAPESGRTALKFPARADRHQRVVPDPAHRQGGQPGHRRGLEARDLPLQVLRAHREARRHRLHTPTPTASPPRTATTPAPSCGR